MQRGSFVSLLNYCFPLVRINGYHVKCHWTIIFFLFIYIHYFTVEMSLRMGPGMALLLAVLSTLMLYTIVLIHEMGHGAAGRRLRAYDQRLLAAEVEVLDVCCHRQLPTTRGQGRNCRGPVRPPTRRHR